MKISFSVLLVVALLDLARAQTPTTADSLHLQRVSIQDTFLLRIIPEYITFRLAESAQGYFAKKGVIVVVMQKVRLANAIRYLVRTEYDNYYLWKQWQRSPPLFYTQLNGRYVVVCDEWVGHLVAVSRTSQQQAIAEFAGSGWLDLVKDKEGFDAMMETLTMVYTWQPKK